MWFKIFFFLKIHENNIIFKINISRSKQHENIKKKKLNFDKTKPISNLGPYNIYMPKKENKAGRASIPGHYVVNDGRDAEQQNKTLIKMIQKNIELNNCGKREM